MSSAIAIPDGSTQTFAVLGHPVAHSLSPAMHNPALQQMGINGVYLAYDVRPERLPEILPAMAQMGFAGCNLTIPHKEVAFRFIQNRADTANEAGSVNTVVFHPDGTLEGHSTDGYGLSKAVEEAAGHGFEGANVLVLGCGGAGRAAGIQVALEGADRLVLANRTVSKAHKLASEIQSRFPRVKVEVSEVWPPEPEVVRDQNLILQSTSMGMDPDQPPLLDASHFTSGQFLLDMTYTQKETPIMREIVRAGGNAVNGLGMLLHQGVRSLEIWTGRDVPVETMRRALQEHIYGDHAHVS